MKNKYRYLFSFNGLMLKSQKHQHRGNKSKWVQKIITAAAIRHVLIRPKQAAIICISSGDKSPSLLAILEKFENWAKFTKSSLDSY